MRNTVQFALIVTGIAVGMLLTAQFNTPLPPSSSYPFEQYEAAQELIKSYLDEQSLLKSRIAALRKDLDKIQSEVEQEEQSQDLNVLHELKRELGLTEVAGQGIAIELDDSKKANRQSRSVDEDMLVHAADLRDTINVVRSVGPEAITINDQRVVLTTSIRGVGNTILVDNTGMLPPFTISVIGNPEALISRLTSKESLPDIYRRVRENGLIFKISPPRPYIHLPFYSGTYGVNLMKSASPH